MALRLLVPTPTSKRLIGHAVLSSLRHRLDCPATRGLRARGCEPHQNVTLFTARKAHTCYVSKQESLSTLIIGAWNMYGHNWTPALLLAVVFALQATVDERPRSHREGHLGKTSS